MSAKTDLHRLVDELPDAAIAPARRFLEFLRDCTIRCCGRSSERRRMMNHFCRTMSPPSTRQRRPIGGATSSLQTRRSANSSLESQPCLCVNLDVLSLQQASKQRTVWQVVEIDPLAHAEQFDADGQSVGGTSAGSA